MIVRYDSNNSGGDWWLSDDDWKKLEDSGWKVDWVRDRESLQNRLSEDGRWLGALATKASKEFPSIEEAIEEWSLITKKNPDALGCECCGRPHLFYQGWEDE